MNKLPPLTGLLIALWAASLAHGHGTPIHVEVPAGKLVVSQGLADSLGFAPMIFLEDDEDGEPFAEISIPPFGPVILWQLPGFEILGMNDDSSLSIEVLLRPLAGSSPVEKRTLWYWNDETQLVEPAPSDSAIHLLARANQSRTLASDDLAAPLPLLLSDPLTGQQGFHNHALLYYALGNDPAPPTGVYGFFARLTSDSYAPSDPFLAVFNRGIIDYQQMIPAALAINAAAMVAQPIPGDYDADGHVDAADYAVWRARFGNSVGAFTSPDGNGNGAVDAADYVIWRRALNTGSIAMAVSRVPEPSALVMAAMFGLLTATYGRCRTRGVARPIARNQAHPWRSIPFAA